ncbi:AGAP005735-PA-like protein [Anopheles sinensis]|uniref:AGAP005735-PA-like protein n=1 Tax=Anopheles sinensis TaxID=74873 RepID=A0A084WJJ0_ANOSI|nr:AGAP005735-PA-like protein [Anopheles sinensis]
MGQPSKIFINPKFAKAHINPMFLASHGSLMRVDADHQVQNPPQQAAIHVNPAFLQKLRSQQVTTATTVAATVTSAAPAAMVTSANAYRMLESRPSEPAGKPPPFSGAVNPIIKNTRRKLIRATTASGAKVTAMHNPNDAKRTVIGTANSQLAPLVKIGKNKLIRSSVPATTGMENVKPKVLPERKSLRIDRRIPPRSPMEKPSFVKRYALSRINGINPKKVVITDRKLLKLKRNIMPVKKVEKAIANKSTVAYASKNKRLVLVNINGVLYRSSNNKLQKSLPAVSKSAPASSYNHPAKTKEHFLIIRGTRFALDRTGMKLRTIRDAAAALHAPEPRMNRIDIGGLTYKARKDGTFIRTDNHRTRSHLSTAKQRSIQVLASKLKKCNEPCHIYRRLGKCLAHNRGKCPKLHDPKHVSICQKFLRGECILDGCLLSHNVSLEKMPVCTFFLEGRCMRDVCPYLHKKVSEKERICDAFLNGFCALADKCPNRHIFQCPEFERNGKCDRIKCPYPHGRKEMKKKPAAGSNSPVTVETTAHPETIALPALPVRYYQDDGTSRTSSKVNQPEKSGELSASERMQLKRMLGEVDKMKQRHAHEEVDQLQPAGSGIQDDGESVSIEGEPDDDDGGDRKTAGGWPADDAVPEDENAGGSDEEEDTRPPVLRRKALGTLPSFIPI